MSQYKAGFEIDSDDPKTEEIKIEDHKEFSYKKGFVLDEEPQEAKIITTDDLDPENLTTVDLVDLSKDDYEEPTTKLWSSPILWILSLLMIFGGLQVYQLLFSAFEQNLLVGIAWSAIIAVALVIALISLYKEIHAVWMLKNTELNRMKIKELLDQGNGQSTIDLCKEMYANTKHKNNQSYETFLKRVEPHFEPQEILSIYENIILKEHDQKAKSIVIKRSRENGVVVALSPIAWLDMVFTMARSLRMIREIAETYGYHCGLWGRIQLYRKVIKNIIFIGITDLATDAIIDSVGAETFAKLSAAIGQGLAAGIYSTRLGYMTIKAVRPVPISKKVITLAELRKEMITGALEILKNKSKS